MLMFITWLIVLGSALSWRFIGAVEALQILFAGVVCLLLAVRSWFAVPRRVEPAASHVTLIDLQARRIEAFDEYVRGRLAAGDDPEDIASSTGWWKREEEGVRGRLG